MPSDPQIHQATSVVSFLTAVEKLHNPLLFRGQTNIAWPVLPSLARKVDSLKESTFIGDTWKSYEEELIDEFKRYSAPWLTFVPQDRFEWLVLAQHHGLPTVLLDFTPNPLKALFFAVEDVTFDQVDGAVYGVEPYLGWYTGTDKIQDNNEDLICFYPKHINPRLVSQESCFMAFAFPEGLQPFKPLTVYNKQQSDPNGWLERIIVPKTAKASLRKELSRMGITHQALFPGLDGIAETVKRNMGWF